MKKGDKVVYVGHGHTIKKYAVCVIVEVIKNYYNIKWQDKLYGVLNNDVIPFAEHRENKLEKLLEDL